MKAVAVIGAGIGGLTAAGLLARKGHRVTVFEATSTVGGKAQRFEREGLRFDTGPTVMTMPATLRSTFELLGASDLMPELIRLTLHSRNHFADGRTFDCFDDLDQAAASADGIEPNGGKKLLAFYKAAARIYEAAGAPYLDAPYESFAGFIARAARRAGPTALMTGASLATLETLAKHHFASNELRQFVGRFATYAGAAPSEANAAFAMIAHLERDQGVHHVRGGISALIDALAQAVTRLGVEVRLNSRAEWQREGSRFVVCDTVFDSVVVNADPLASLGRDSERLTLSGQVYFFAAAKRLTSLPHHTIVFSSDTRREFAQLAAGEVPTEPTLHLCHPAATDFSMATGGQSGLYVMANVPPLSNNEDASSWSLKSERLKATCLERLRKAVAPLAHVELRSVGERSPVDLALQGAPRGSIYGYLPRGRFGPFRRPPLRSSTPGVFFAGGGTYPGGGVPLVMLSGQFAATLAEQHLEATR